MANRSRSNSNDPNAESLMNADETREDEVTIGQIDSPKKLWTWFMKDPCSRWQLIFFLLMFILSIFFVIMALVNPDYSYTEAGIAGIIVAGYGAFHFKTLMALREEVDVFERHNNEFKRQNAQLAQEMKKLENTKEELESSRITLQETSKKNKENLEKFEKISHNLEIMGEQNIAGLSKITQMTKGIASKWKEELVGQERQLFMAVYEELETKDGDEEMTKKEYEGFLDTLPPKYRMQLQHQHTFEQLAGDNDTISYQEFSDLLDELARGFASTSKQTLSAGNRSPVTQVTPVTPVTTGNGNNIVEETN